MRDSEALLRLIFEAARRAGIDRHRLCDRLGCTPDLLTDPSGRCPHELQPYFWGALEALTGDDDIGLNLCPDLPGFDGHRLEYVLLSSATLRDGLMFARRHRRVLSDAMQLSLVESRGRAALELQATAYDDPRRRHTEICASYAILRALRTVPLAPSPILGITLGIGPVGNPEDYSRVFGMPVAFDRSRINRIAIRPEALDARLPLADSDIAALHRDMVARKSAPISQQDVLDRIRAELFSRCQSGFGVTARLPEMASFLGLPERRIREALAEMGTSFRNVLSETRVRVAERLLCNTDASPEFIARAAGFADSTALSRAFAQTQGMPPLRYRRHVRRECPSVRLSDPETVLCELKRKAEQRLMAMEPAD